MAGQCHCGRVGRGFQFIDYETPEIERRPIAAACSIRCLKTAAKVRGNVKELIRQEQEAALAASEEVGSFLESIGKTDLAAMTQDEWLGFIGHTYAVMCERVADICADEVPF